MVQTRKKQLKYIKKLVKVGSQNRVFEVQIKAFGNLSRNPDCFMCIPDDSSTRLKQPNSDRAKR